MKTTVGAAIRVRLSVRQAEKMSFVTNLVSRGVGSKSVHDAGADGVTEPIDDEVRLNRWGDRRSQVA